MHTAIGIRLPAKIYRSEYLVQMRVHEQSGLGAPRVQTKRLSAARTIAAGISPMKPSAIAECPAADYADKNGNVVPGRRSTFSRWNSVVRPSHRGPLLFTWRGSAPGGSHLKTCVPSRSKTYLTLNGVTFSSEDPPHATTSARKEYRGQRAVKCKFHKVLSFECLRSRRSMR